MAVLKYYKVDSDGKIKRLRRECPSPECGAGIFMSLHSNRQYCGKCGLTYLVSAILGSIGLELVELRPADCLALRSTVRRGSRPRPVNVAHFIVWLPDTVFFCRTSGSPGATRALTTSLTRPSQRHWHQRERERV